MDEVKKLVYDKPVVEFWSAEELDAIQATMSGGWGGWSGGGHCRFPC